MEELQHSVKTSDVVPPDAVGCNAVSALISSGLEAANGDYNDASLPKEKFSAILKVCSVLHSVRLIFLCLDF